MTTISCEAGQLKKFIDSIRTMDDECRLHFSADGISTSLVNRENVAMVLVNYPASAMKMYKFNKTCPEKVAVNWSKFPKLLSEANEHTPVTVNFTKDRVTISYGQIKACVKYIEEMSVKKDAIPLPKMILNGAFEVDGTTLARFNRVLVSDKVKLAVKNGIVTIESYENSDEHVKKILATDAKKGEFKSLYSWDYLKEISKVLNGAYVAVNFDTDHPLKMESTVNGIQVTYLLAPRIESS
ncbi:MAG: hypothetical protein PHG61_10135 [Candidatus Marinimicrobia bacterium]|nr:hypothetical protein [Candidatus Neomarinimicrobiota bacterium]